MVLAYLFFFYLGGMMSTFIPFIERIYILVPALPKILNQEGKNTKGKSHILLFPSQAFSVPIPFAFTGAFTFKVRDIHD